MRVSRSLCAFVFAAACGSVLCGCALFQMGMDVVGYWPNSESAKDRLLSPVRPARDALQIEVTFAERPVGDPLLSTELWADIDQVGAVPIEEREALGRLGLLVGNAGSTPGKMLERLLRPIDPLDTAAAKDYMPIQKQTFFLRSSEQAPVETNSLARCTLDVPVSKDMKEKTYENFKSVLRLTAMRLQDGWAQLQFDPEIHYGTARLRPLAATQGPFDTWQQRESQEIDSLVSQRFSVKLKVGEMVVITAAADKPRSFGHNAFMRPDETKGLMQRLLVVRFSNMSRMDPIYAQPARGQ